MKIGILDDEDIWRKRLYNEVLNYSIKNNMSIDISVFTSNDELKDVGEEIDLLLLDICMPHITGIDIKNTLPNHIMRVVFVTSHDEQMINAFGDRVYGFVDKCHLERLFGYIKKIYHLALCQEHILINGSYVKNESIYYLKGEGVYTSVFADQEIVVRKKLKEFENELRQDMFMRVHKSYIINLQHIKSIDYKGVILDNHSYVKISRGMVNHIKKAYAQYMMRL